MSFPSLTGEKVYQNNLSIYIYMKKKNTTRGAVPVPYVDMYFMFYSCK